jgi:hypothetical protein
MLLTEAFLKIPSNINKLLLFLIMWWNTLV